MKLQVSNANYPNWTPITVQFNVPAKFEKLKEIAKKISNKGLLIGIDRDEEAICVAKERLKEFPNVKSALKYINDLYRVGKIKLEIEFNN